MGHLLEILNNEDENPFDPEKARIESEVDLNTVEDVEAITLSYGQEWNGDPLCVFGEGDYSVITGDANTRKSFLKSALLASYIGGQTNFGYFKSHRRTEKWVLDIDTEMSKKHVKKFVRRIHSLVGSVYPKYKSYSLKKYSDNREKFAVVQNIVETYGDQIGILSIDGFADLMVDTNDNVESVQLANQLMSWCDKYQIHITGILHTNPKSDKMRGHLGSEVARKAATVLRCQVANELAPETTVSHGKARDMKFKKFEFTIEQGLPVWRESEEF